MTVFIGSYSALRGPAGRALSDYILENIPALWQRSIVRIESVGNTGAVYTGEIAGYDLSDPFTYSSDQTFWFTPHVDSLASPTLSLNGLASLPILRQDGVAVAAGDLKTTGRYLLRCSVSAFHLVGGSPASFITPLAFAANITGTITVGGTAQVVSAAEPKLVRLIISAAAANIEPLYFGRGVAAVVGVGDPIWPGTSYDSGYPPEAADQLAISLIAATTGTAFIVKRKILS